MFKFDLGFDVDVGYAVPPVAVIVSDEDHHKTRVFMNLSVLGFLAAGAFFLFVSLWLLCFYRVKLEQARLRLYSIIDRRAAGEIVIINSEQVQPLEDDGDLVDHPIWYIRSQGLQQSVIDSISVVKYKKGEGLVEGTDCSVCLSEFEEDESLRLLPQCAHAFHVPCIDQWFRSHKNCPLCRSPVTLAATTILPAEEVREAVRLQQIERESNENPGGLLEGQQQVVENVITFEEDSDSSSVSENGSIGLIAKPESESQRVSDSEVQCMQRWVSAGPVTASKMYGAVAEIKIQVDLGSSPIQGSTATGSGRNSPQTEQARTQGSSMKRSASCGGKPSSAKSGTRKKNTTLPY